jgi:hypothetical protein
MRLGLLTSAAVMSLVTLWVTPSDAQTWTSVSSSPPAGVSLCLLLTDGGVMCQASSNWYKLTPSSTGSYTAGTWSKLASFPSGYNPDAFASAVLADGRVVVVGGEYLGSTFTLSNLGAIYNPVSNTWTSLTPPPSTGAPNHWQCIGDAPASILADGRFAVGSKLYQDVAVLNPSNLTWSPVSVTGKTDAINSEEGWTLLPDGSIFTLDVRNAPASERLLIAAGATTGQWASSGPTPQDLHTPTTSSPLTAPGCPTYYPPGEVGPVLLMPSGKVFAVGADGYTAIYTPPTPGSTAPGSWSQGPALAAGLNVEDGPGAVLPSGNVLFGASPGASSPGLSYYEFNGASLVSVPAPANAAYDATYYTSLLPLPTGQVLFVDGTTTVQVYTPAASPTYNTAWAPTITSVPSTITNGTTYAISGTQFNGLTQASAFGDESQNATGYPLVRITNTATGHVFYARTHGHSTMAVATGATPVSTNFDVPVTIEAGASTLQVVANGIPSAAANVTVTVVPLTTTTALTTSVNPALYGQTVTLTGTTGASVGVPTGTMTFMNGATSLGVATLNANGVATLTTNTLPVAGNVLSAVYGGTAAYAGSTSPTVTEAVNPASTTATISSSHSTQKTGLSVTFTARVAAKSPSSGTPSGTVVFRDGATTLATVTLASGQATYSTSALSKGTHSITVVYNGSGNYLTSTSAALTQTMY